MAADRQKNNFTQSGERKGGMNFDEYQKLASRTAQFREGTSDEYKLMYTCLGLAGEAGELIEKIKKVIRNHDGNMTEESRSLIRLEIGDVLWYLSQVSRFCDVSFQEAADANIKKLSDRHARGVIRGEGDTR